MMLNSRVCYARRMVTATETRRTEFLTARDRHTVNATGRAVMMRTAVAIALLVLGSPALRAAGSTAGDNARLLACADSLWGAAARDSSAALLERTIPLARAGRDTTFLLDLLIRRGGQLVSFGQFAPAEPLLREARLMAEARADSARLCWALRWLGPAVGDVGDAPQAEPVYTKQLELARALGKAGFEGWARCGMGWCADRRGHYVEAIVHYEAAIACFERCGDRYARAFARNALGTVLQGNAQYAEAARAYRTAAADARELRYDMVEGLALNNLATLEMSLGDPGRALVGFRRAHEIQADIGHSREALVPLLNVAECEARLGRYTAAAATLADIVELSAQHDYRDLRAISRLRLAGVLRLQDRPAAAIRMLRESEADSVSLNPGERIELLIQLADALASQDSVDAALAVLEDGSRLAGEDTRDLPALALGCRLGGMLTDRGRAAEGLLRLLAVESEARRAGLAGYRVDALAGAAEALVALQRPDSVVTLLERAAAVWESVREVPLDPEWREQRGASGRLVHTSLAAAIIGAPRPGRSARAEAAFVRLQAFKARTLHERMAGPSQVGTAVNPPFDLEEFRRETLRPGELFLDAYLGPRVSWLFAVTRDSLRASELPPADELATALRFQRALHLAAIETGGDRDDRAATGVAARALSEKLLAPAADLIEASIRIIFAPDDVLNLISLGELPFPGTRTDEPLLTRREYVVVPSATVLTRLRRADTAATTSGVADLHLLTISGGRDSEGGQLRGARREARRLREKYRGIDWRETDPSGYVSLASDDLAACDALHVAMHARVADQAPWRSALGFTTGPDSAEVTAADIAEMHLTARLAVLSGCGTAGGRTLSGEGVQGLTSAFLAAGVSAVVATLWPVDDHTTADLMECFYAELAAGHTAAAALRTAQMTIRDHERRSHPFYWAGFVLVGDGDVRLALESRPGRRPVPIIAGGVLCAVALAAGGFRLVRRRRV